MTVTQLIANYSPTVDICSLFFSCILMFIIAKVLFFYKDKKFAFLKRALGFIAAGSICNIAFYLVIEKCPNSIYPVFLFRDLYHLSFMCSLYCFMLYMKYMIDMDRNMERFITYLSRALFLICIVLDLLAPITKIGFYMEDGIWYDPIVSPYNAFYVYAYVMMFQMLIFYSKRIIRYVRICLGLTGVLIGGIMIYQGIADINTYTSFTYVLPVFVVMVLLHSKPFDDKTGALDAVSFDSFVKQCVHDGTSVDYITLKLNINILETLPTELGKVLNSFWHDYFKNALSFSIASDVFVLAIPREKRNGNTEEKINKLISETFFIYYEQYKVPYKLIAMFDFGFVENLTDILGISKYLLSTMEENSIKVIDKNLKPQFLIMKKVKENLADIDAKKDLDDPRVLVYYQPVRNMKTGEFDTAEALVRLKLEGTDVIMPFMFISMAEEYGYIGTLTKIILNKVCKNVKQLLAEGYEFKRVSVNVSAVDMKSEGFCEELVNIIRDNDLSTSKIGIELTESRTDRDFMILKEKMKILHDAGIALYLDDVGTGYSNLDRIVQYDVDVVKFDRFFLLEAEKSMKIIKMMSHLSQAFQDLEYKLLFEGVETEAHEALCRGCGSDYIQGFKYSKPIPFEEFKTYLTKNKKAASEQTVVAAEIPTPLTVKRDFTYSEIKDHYSVLISMSKLFYSMHIIDLINNTAKPYNPTEDIKVVDVVNSTMGADEMMKQIMRMCTVDEHVPAVLEFTDLSTIADRMINKKILSAEYIGKSIGWYVASFYTIEADEKGRPTKVVFTTRSIDDEKKAQMNKEN